MRPLRGGGRGWTLFAVAVGWLLILGTRLLVPVILPQVKLAFDISNATAGLAITLSWAGYALMQFPAGVLGDRFGYRTLLAASLLLTGVSLAFLGAAPYFWVFMIAIAAFGLGTGLYGPTRGIVLSRTFPRNDSTVFGITLAAGSLGSALLPLFGGVLVSRLGWRLVVGLPVALFLAMTVATWRAVPAMDADSREPDPEADHEEDDTTPDRSDGPRLSTRDRLREIPAAVADRTVLVLIGAGTLMLFAYQGMTAFLPTYLIEVKGLDQGFVAGLFATLFLSGAAFQLMIGRIADVHGGRTVLVALSLGGVVTVGALPFVDGAVPLVVLVVLLGSRLAVGPVANAYVVRILPDHIQGSAWGLLRTGYFLVGSFGSTFVGAFADMDLFDEAFFVLAGLTLLAAGLYALLPSGRDARG